MGTMTLREGHVLRHVPMGAGAKGLEVALIDIAQDLLLAHMQDVGVLDDLAIKGGTAIRKLYAGNEGRFSVDLDFVSCVGDGREEGELFVLETDGLTIDPFTYGVTERRGKWSLTFSCRFFSTEALPTIKLDFLPMPWLTPILRSWVSLPIHRQYGFELPQICTVRLEENIAEKVARLNRTTTLRDIYDLSWLMTNVAVASTIDRALVRRLAVLKIWVDTNGMHAGNVWWRPAHQGSIFDPLRWLRVRDMSEFGTDDISPLATNMPTIQGMTDVMRREFSFLAGLDETESVIARSDERDRTLVIKALSELKDTTYDPSTLY